MSNPITRFFRDCDVKIENSKTSENFDLFVKEVENSHFNLVINVITNELLKRALESGWNEDELPLGDFIAKDDEVQKSGKLDVAREILDMFSDYGRLYFKDKETPFILITVKKTGKPVSLDDQDLVRAFVENGIDN